MAAEEVLADRGCVAGCAQRWLAWAGPERCGCRGWAGRGRV